MDRPTLPEPCLKPPCYAPEQCGRLGYCSARDAKQSRDSSWKRRRAATRKADTQSFEELGTGTEANLHTGGWLPVDDRNQSSDSIPGMETASALREEARRCLQAGKATGDRVEKLRLASRALELAQRAQALERAATGKPQG
jgi:hypothetical protein